jgi:hypothetical protein
MKHGIYVQWIYMKYIRAQNSNISGAAKWPGKFQKLQKVYLRWNSSSHNRILNYNGYYCVPDIIRILSNVFFNPNIDWEKELLYTFYRDILRDKNYWKVFFFTVYAFYRCTKKKLRHSH